jgi:predicted metal-dependent hydrolase
VAAPPKWARKLLRRVARDTQRRTRPRLKWRRQRRRLSSGWCHLATSTIMIHAGTARRDQKLVLLHELAHWLVQAGHTRTFWETAFALYRRYKVPLRYAFKSEQHDKKARAAYRRLRRAAKTRRTRRYRTRVRL